MVIKSNKVPDIAKILYLTASLTIFFILTGRKPKIVVKPKSKIEVNTGLIFLLTCQATGSPAPRVQWYKDGTQIPVTNNRIQTLPSG